MPFFSQDQITKIAEIWATQKGVQIEKLLEDTSILEKLQALSRYELPGDVENTISHFMPKDMQYFPDAHREDLAKFLLTNMPQNADGIANVATFYLKSLFKKYDEYKDRHIFISTKLKEAFNLLWAKKCPYSQPSDELIDAFLITAVKECLYSSHTIIDEISDIDNFLWPMAEKAVEIMNDLWETNKACQPVRAEIDYGAELKGCNKLITEVAREKAPKKARKDPRLNVVEEQLSDKQRIVEQLWTEFNKQFQAFFTTTCLPKIRTKSIDTDKAKRERISDKQGDIFNVPIGTELPDVVIEALLKFFTKGKLPKNTIFSTPFHMYDAVNSEAAKNAPLDKLREAFERIPLEENGVVCLDLNTGGHWVPLKITKTVHAKKESAEEKLEIECNITYFDSVRECNSKVVPRISDLLQKIFNENIKITYEEIPLGTQAGEGFSCGDHSIAQSLTWTIGKDHPWFNTSQNSGSAANGVAMRRITQQQINIYLPSVGKPPIQFDSDNSTYEHRRTQFTSASSTKSYFDDHGFQLFLLFSLAILCFVAVGFGLTALFGTGHALEVAAKFFVVPAALSLKSAAFISVIAGGIGGPTILYVIWQGLVNFKNGFIDFFTPKPTVTAPPIVSPLPEGTSQQKGQPCPDPRVVESLSSPISQVSKLSETPGGQLPSQLNAPGHPRVQ